MIVLGIDPGCGHTGWAVVRLTFGLGTEIKDGRSIYHAGAAIGHGILQAGTWRVDHKDFRDWWAENFGLAIDLVCVQTPLSDTEATPMWRNRGQGRISPMSIARNAGLSGWYCGWFDAIGKPVMRCPSQNCRTWGMKAPERVWRAAWGYAGRISADARDAAQIALHGAQAWGRAEHGKQVMAVLARACGATGGGK